MDPVEVLAKYGVRCEDESTSDQTSQDAIGGAASTRDQSSYELSGQKADDGAGSPSTRKPVSVEIWRSGRPIREFLWSEDMADADSLWSS